MASPGQKFVVYADGSCLGNPGAGGWGVVILEPGGIEHEFSGSEPRTTNNRMELTAAINGLRQTPQGARVLVCSDSKYLVDSMTLGWKRNANLDLWKQLDEEAAARQVDFQWVRGHAGDPLNRRADELANAAAQGLSQKASEASLDMPRAGRVSGATSDDRKDLDEQESLRRVQTMLRAGEVVRKCAECGGRFITSENATPPFYCSLVACQIKARLS